MVHSFTKETASKLTKAKSGQVIQLCFYRAVPGIKLSYHAHITYNVFHGRTTAVGRFFNMLYHLVNDKTLNRDALAMTLNYQKNVLYPFIAINL